MLRWLKLHSLQMSRKYPKTDARLLARLMRSRLVRWNRTTVTRGAAVGMFWAFTPIPFQMLPATLFCWIVGGNLPLTLLCVWVSNPITVPPILLLEYRIGEVVLSLYDIASPLVGETSSIYASFAGGLSKVLAGSLILSVVMSIASYVLLFCAFLVSDKNRKHRLSKLYTQARRRYQNTK